MITKADIYILCYSYKVFKSIKRHLICSECLVKAKCLHIDLRKRINNKDGKSSTVYGMFRMRNSCEKLIDVINDIPPEVRKKSMTITINSYVLPWNQWIKIEDGFRSYKFIDERYFI